MTTTSSQTILQNPQTNIEPMGLAPKSKITKSVEERFKDIFETISGNPYHVEERQQLIVYNKLMNHVEAIEKKNRKGYSHHLKRAAAAVLFSGLTAALVCSLAVDPTNHWRLLRQRMWQWVVMTMMLTGVFSIVPFATFLLFWLFKRYFRTSKYAVYFLRRMKGSLDVTLWACLVLLGWYAWFRPRLKHVHGDISVIVVSQITRLFIALCIGCALWTVKNALHLKLKADLHYDQLFDRIAQTIVYLNGIQILDRRPSRIGEKTHEAEFLAYDKYGSKINCSDGVRQVCTNIWMDVLRMKRETVPIWILQRLSEEYLNEAKLVRPPQADDLLKNDEILLSKANKTFEDIVQNKDREVKREHLSLPVYDLSIEELDYLFKLKQTTTPQEIPDKAISADKFLNWVVRAHKNCWSLEQTLVSSKIAFVKLNRMLSAFLLVLVVIIWLLLSKIVNTAQLALLFAPFLAASFMFENSSKNMFHGIIFAFAMHPFDVGDRVIIEDTQMRVKVMHILTSVFVKYDTGAEVIFPNSKLSTTKIVNLDITPDQSDKLEFVIHIDTPLEDIKDLELKIQKLLDDHLFYASGTKVVKNSYQNPENPSELKMTVHFKYLVSYLTTETKAARRSEILTMIMRLWNELKENRKEFSPKNLPFDLELSPPPHVKMSGIEHLKRELLCSLEQMGYKYCKVVMTDLIDGQLKMALFASISNKDMSPAEAEKVMSDLKSEKFFASLLSEFGYTNLTVFQDEKLIYRDPNWRSILGGNLPAATEQVKAADADSKEGVQESQN